MHCNDLFSLAPLPPDRVPSRTRRLVLITLIWLVGLGFVTAAQIELGSIDPGGLNAAQTDSAFSPAPLYAQLGPPSRSEGESAGR